MLITVKDVLAFDSMNQAELITGEEGLDQMVRGAMVMEALDIHEWGQEGQMLLTSYFAFKEATLDNLDAFFSQAKAIGIAGFIFKKNRLIHEIPAYFVEKCTAYQFPIIQVDKETRYETIINDILVSIINRDALLLKSYYTNQQHFVQLMMNQASSYRIIETLRTLIGQPVSLIEKSKDKIIGTEEAFHHFQVIENDEAVEKDFMNISYREQLVSYPLLSSLSPSKLLSFTVPSLGYEDYELLIHTQDSELKDTDLMAVVNTVAALQIELVKEYALKQNNHSRLNEMASDLIHNRLTSKEDVDETIHYLNLDSKKQYKVIVFTFENKLSKESSPVHSRLTDSLVYNFKSLFPDAVYITRTQKIIFIVNTDPLALTLFKEKMRDMLQLLLKNKEYEKITIQVAISLDVTVYDLPEGYRQAVDTQKIMSLLETAPPILSYQDTGLYQLFLETNTLASLEHFIPVSVRELKENKPELLETLFTFINKNQNYSETAQSLFVHPKTVRYRINQLREQYAIDFQNPEEMLRYSIAIRILKVLPTHQVN